MMIESLQQSLNAIVLQTKANTHTLLIITITLWGCYILTLLTGRRLLLLGIIPRHLRGIPGIFLAPLLHADFNHLFFNTIPLIVLSNFILLQGLPYFITVTVMITVLSGLAIWFFAKPGVHVGASALVTGYWGLLVCNIYNQGGIINIILGAISIYYFAGIFFGIFPSKKGVSWEGHLFGLIAGLVTSYTLN